MKHCRLFLTVIFWIGCLTGFIFQSKQVCGVYFKYHTRTVTTLTLETEVPTPSLSVCHSYPLILNRTDYKKYGIAKDAPRVPTDAGWKEKDQSVLTIRQLFDLTRDGNDTINSCQRRRRGMWLFDEEERDVCLQEIQVTKYFMQEFICYMYSFINMSTLSVVKISHAASYIQAIFSLTVKDNPPSALLYIFVHPNDGVLPLLSRNFGKEVYRVTNDAGYTKPNQVYITFRLHEIHRLPPPYDTSCTFDKSDERFMCLRLCLIEKMKKIDRFPDTEITIDPVDLRHSCIYDFYNETSYQVLDSIYESCELKCPRLSCHDNFMTTDVQPYFDLGGKNVVWMRLSIPDSPSLHIHYTVSVSFLDFFVYMCSSFGIWFGLSVASLNPMKFKVPKVFTTTNKKSTTEQKMDLLMQIVSDLKRRVDAQNRR